MSGFAVTITAIDNTVAIIPWVDNPEDETQVLKDAVGGWLEAVQVALPPLCGTPYGYMWVNEEGKLLGLPHNEGGTFMYSLGRASLDRIVGNVIITGPCDDDGYTTGLPIEGAHQIQIAVTSVLEVTL